MMGEVVYSYIHSLEVFGPAGKTQAIVYRIRLYVYFLDNSHIAVVLRVFSSTMTFSLLYHLSVVLYNSNVLRFALLQ